MDDSETSESSVEELILRRLANSNLDERSGDLIVAALLGDAELTAAISTHADEGVRPDPAAVVPVGAPARVYLRSIEVAGFRGIGPAATLHLHPGPGLTVVVGRNGSGKSSFAEAAELTLTGQNKRWSDRTAIWRAGWRNLHTTGPARIGVKVAIDGVPGTTALTREWPADAALDDAETFVQAPGAARQPLRALGWSKPLELYRPFLSYAELGALVTGKPSEMYDALQAILGLDLLIAALRRLTEARKAIDLASKQARTALPEMLQRLAESPDARARQAEGLVRQRSPDLAAIDALAAGAAPADDAVVRGLSLVAAIELPDSATVAEDLAALAAAQDKAAGLADSAAADAKHLAELLRGALEYHATHPGGTCPVCGGRTLDSDWAAHTRAEVDRLIERAKDAAQAQEELDTAIRAVKQLTGPQPLFLNENFDLLAGVAAARERWQEWAGLTADGSATRLFAEAGPRFDALRAAVGALRDDAAGVLRQHSGAWQPVAAALRNWAGLCRASQQATVTLGQVRKALDWLREAGDEIRNARLGPFAAKSATVWDSLRQESNVDLGPIRLEGTSTQRRVALDVTIDGQPGAALSVMSQGELHALGLALFLPRATAEDSPFRFMVIDDPVQSMDPAKVDGLARLLALVGGDRQVVVFTHDNRLPEAIRRLQIPATIWEVSRRERSVVDLKKNDDAVSRYLDDARAIALTGALPEAARGVIVAGFCRCALEAACHEAVWERRLRAGARHAEIEDALARVRTLHEVTALALFDDAGQGGLVSGRLHKLGGQNAVNAFNAAKAGTHEGYRGDLKELVSDVSRLAGLLRP